jgi:hypothetical protein
MSMSNERRRATLTVERLAGGSSGMSEHFERRSDGGPDVAGTLGQKQPPAARAKGSRPRRWQTAVTVAVLPIAVVAVIVAACGPGSSGSPPRPGAVDSKQPSNDPDFARTPQSRLSSLTAAQATSLSAAPWKLLAVGAAGRRLEIGFASGIPGCASTAGLFVHETDTSVLIDVLTRFRGGEQACASALEMGRATVQLQRPLGDRSLLHAVVDSKWHTVDQAFFAS